MRVHIYWNFGDNLFTVKRADTGSIKDQVPSLMLKDAKFIVRADERDETRRTGKRSFHATVEGEPVPEVEGFDEWTAVMYDVYDYDHFVTFDEKKPVEEATHIGFKVVDKMPRMFAKDITYKVEESA